MSVRVLAHLLIDLCVFLLGFKSSLHILDSSSLWDVSFAHISSWSVACRLLSSMCLTQQKFLIFMKCTYQLLSSMAEPLVLCLKRHLHDRGHLGFSSLLSARASRMLPCTFYLWSISSYFLWGCKLCVKIQYFLCGCQLLPHGCWKTPVSAPLCCCSPLARDELTVSVGSILVPWSALCAFSDTCCLDYCCLNRSTWPNSLFYRPLWTFIRKWLWIGPEFAYVLFSLLAQCLPLSRFPGHVFWITR